MFKFKKNETFRNVLKTYPKYIFRMSNNRIVLNNLSDQGQLNNEQGFVALQVGGNLSLSFPYSEYSVLFDKTASNPVASFDIEETQSADGGDFLKSADGGDFLKSRNSISAWVYPVEGSSSTFPRIMHLGNQNSGFVDNKKVFYMFSSSSLGKLNIAFGQKADVKVGSLGFDIGTDAVLSNGEIIQCYTTDERVVPFNKWSHVAVSFSDTDAKFYINGERMLRHRHFPGGRTGELNPLIGSVGNSTVGGKSFPGYIDEVALTTRGVTDDEVSELYNQGKPPDLAKISTGLKNSILSYWRMGDGDDADPDVFDQVSANHITMSAFANSVGGIKKFAPGKFELTEEGLYGSVKVPMPLVSTISRVFVYKKEVEGETVTYDEEYTKTSDVYRILALKNTIEYYKPLSEAYNFDNLMLSGGRPHLEHPDVGAKVLSEHKMHPSSSINLISIPKIFYDEGIKKGSVDLKFYVTGNLTARAQDINENGALIQTTGSTSGSIVGFVLYNEGFLVLTGSDSLNTDISEPYIQPIDSQKDVVTDSPKWIHFGAYKSNTLEYNDIISSSYELEFEGTHKINTITMFAHAPKNLLNWSNNFSYISASQGNQILFSTGSKLFWENEDIQIKNTISSSHYHSESYSQQTYINKIGVYDEEENLIGIATLANPVRKKPDQSYTFKLKMDL